jgi:hypothetical protein
MDAARQTGLDIISNNADTSAYVDRAMAIINGKFIS